MSIVQPRPLPAQPDDSAGREIRVLETVEPVSGRRSLHVLEGLSADEVRAVQRALSRAGFGEAWREGSLDPFTRGALQRFQTRRGLAVCACVSLETLIELSLRVRVAETVVLAEPSRPPEADVGEARGDEVGPRGAAPTYVDYGRYYPYGVIYLAPYVYPYAHTHGDPIHRIPAAGRPPRAGPIGPGFAAVAHPGGLPVGVVVGSAAAIASSPAHRPLGPFPRVAPPPNVVRGGG